MTFEFINLVDVYRSTLEERLKNKGLLPRVRAVTITLEDAERKEIFVNRSELPIAYIFKFKTTVLCE